MDLDPLTRVDDGHVDNASSHCDADPHVTETMDKGDDAIITVESAFPSEQENVNVDGCLDDLLEFVIDNIEIVPLFVYFG